MGELDFECILWDVPPQFGRDGFGFNPQVRVCAGSVCIIWYGFGCGRVRFTDVFTGSGRVRFAAHECCAGSG